MTRDVLLSMISKNPQLLLNYMQQLSDRSTEQDKRIDLLSQKTLRLKIGHYLLQLLEEQLEDHDMSLEQALRYPTTYAVELPVSKEVVSRLLAMPRPSFSRELISMEKDGLIRVNGRVIWLLDIRGLASDIIVDAEEELPAG
jgi:CRP-like cAMP-binding protein